MWFSRDVSQHIEQTSCILSETKERVKYGSKRKNKSKAKQRNEE